MAKPRLQADDVARLWGVSRSWVYKETQEGRIPHIRLGPRRVVYDPDELDAFEAARRLTAEQAAEHAAEAADRYR